MAVRSQSSRDIARGEGGGKVVMGKDGKRETGREAKAGAGVKVRVRTRGARIDDLFQGEWKSVSVHTGDDWAAQDIPPQVSLITFTYNIFTSFYLLMQHTQTARCASYASPLGAV